MKIPKRRFCNYGLMGALLLSLSSLSARADLAPPSVGNSETTAAESLHGSRRISLQSVPNQGDGLVLINPVLLPMRPSPSWDKAAGLYINHRVYNFPLRTGPVTSPDQYTLANGVIEWHNLIYATNAHFWGGLDPAAPFSTEYGQVPWGAYEIRSKTGNNDVSLDMLRATFSSTDGLLNGEETFLTKGYSDLAVLVLADGSIIKGGPSSQKGVLVIVFVQSKLFNVGDRQSGIDNARNWISSVQNHPDNHGLYALSYGGQVGTNKSFAKVWIGRPAPTAPRILETISGSSVMLTVENADPNQSYLVHARKSLNDDPLSPDAVWRVIGVINGAEQLSVPTTGSKQFFRVSLQ